MLVFQANSRLSLKILLETLQTPYEPFTPNKSGQRSRSLYHRCCWHRVSNLLFERILSLRQKRSSSPTKAVYDPKAFIPHATSLHQGFPHCGRFSTAATRRCLASVSVPMLGITLSRSLTVIALVSHYPTNKLIVRELLSKRPKALFQRTHLVLSRISSSYSKL